MNKKKVVKMISKGLLVVALVCGSSVIGAEKPSGLTAHGRQWRIDLTWEAEAKRDVVYLVERSVEKGGPYQQLPHVFRYPVATDFIGAPNETFFYRVCAAKWVEGKFVPVSSWSDPVSGETLPKNPAGLLEEVQEASVRIATVASHPVSGLTGEWITTRGKPRPAEWKVGASGATGMGLANFVVAVERGYLERAKAVAMVLKAFRFLDQKVERFHGAFSHWIDNETGKALKFSEFDDGGDIVETALLMQGVLIAREYFDRDNPPEVELRQLANRLWRSVDWNWYRKGDSPHLYWHWSPNHGWKMNLPVKGFNESEILYVLGIASPDHAIPVSCFYDGWRGPWFGQEREHFGTRLQLGRGLGGCTFWYYYSSLGLDPREMKFRGRSYFDHFRDLCSVQIAYMRSRADEFQGYDRMWGLSAAPGPDGYAGFKPGKLDNGTIAPPASLAAYLYAPEASQKGLEAMYYEHGKDLFREFGFIQSFNPTRDWRSPTYLGIDAGPVAAMLENHRSGMLWKLFMKAPEIQKALNAIQADPRWNQ